MWKDFCLRINKAFITGEQEIHVTLSKPSQNLRLASALLQGSSFVFLKHPSVALKSRNERQTPTL